MPEYHAVARCLDNLESTMRTLDCWSRIPPDPQRLASTQPFAMDTLTFAEWLQFILIARLRLIIHQELPLPEALCIVPAAEEVLASEHRALLLPLQELDELYRK